MVEEATPRRPEFPGFPDFQANVTFVPLQFFTVVLPHSTRGCVRIVGHMLRKILGWVDHHGNPTCDKQQFSYRDLTRGAGVSRETIPQALREALAKHFIRCVRRPRAARPGQRGLCGIYELCWDEDGAYTDAPEAFNGFYFPEAALMRSLEEDQPVERIKAARKNIPNAFFDEVLPREPLAVLRVVGALLFYSIQWGKGGERRVPVRLSISALSRLTGLSRHHVHRAVAAALERGYITCVEPGRFDPNAGSESRAATYGIRWLHAPANPWRNRTGTTRQPDRSEKVDGNDGGKVNRIAVGKGERVRSEKVNGDRSEKVNGISIKTDLKTSTTAAEYHGGSTPAESAAAASPVELLIQAGFDRPGAGYLAERYAPDLIRQQVEWLPLRKADSNRLGLLRRAIEQNWPKPEKPAGSPVSEAALVFARHYYAGYHGNDGEPVAEPPGRDVQAAEGLVRRLLEATPDASLLAQRGREFGRLVRRKHAGDQRARPYLGGALLLYADEFARWVRAEGERARQAGQIQVQQAREELFKADYHQYLQATERRYRDVLPEVYAVFDRQRQQGRSVIAGGICQDVPTALRWFDAEDTRLGAFAKFFRRHPKYPVLTFAQWDVRHNHPARAAALPPPEVHAG